MLLLSWELLSRACQQMSLAAELCSLCDTQYLGHHSKHCQSFRRHCSDLG